MRRLISSGSSFEAEAGYSRAVVDGEGIFVAGTTGFYYAHMTIDEDPAEQARQALHNVETALVEAGASLADVVQVKYYRRRGLAGNRAGSGRGVRSDPPRGNGLDLWPRRPADENRDRGHRQTR